MKIDHSFKKIGELTKIRNSIHLDPIWQRGPVWSVPKKSLLVDSILRGYDIPMIYLRECERSVRKLTRIEHFAARRTRYADLLSASWDSTISGLEFEVLQCTYLPCHPDTIRGQDPTISGQRIEPTNALPNPRRHTEDH